jgi:hypothetical protein
MTRAKDKPMALSGRSHCSLHNHERYQTTEERGRARFRKTTRSINADAPIAGGATAAVQNAARLISRLQASITASIDHLFSLLDKAKAVV